jgi:hypothetical protein
MISNEVPATEDGITFALYKIQSGKFQISVYLNSHAVCLLQDVPFMRKK